MNRIAVTLLSALIIASLGSSSPARAEGAGDVAELPYGSSSTFAEFHGFLNLEYLDYEQEGSRSGNSTYDQHYFYFAAIARIRQNVTAIGEIEYEHGGEEIKVDRAFIDINLLRPYVNVRAGKFYAPFGLEIREYQSPVRKTVSRPLMTRQLMFNEWTETGLNLYGSAPAGPLTLTYDVAMANGPGDNDGDADTIPDIYEFTSGDVQALQNRDNNSNRTVIGRFGANFAPAGLDVGVSGAGGRWTDTGSESLDWQQIGADAKFSMMGIDVRGEYAKRSVDLPSGAGSSELEMDGYYAQAAYRIMLDLPNVYYLEPVVRYDAIDPNTDTDDDETTQLSFGLNYSPWSHVVVRTEYQMTDEDPKKDNDGLLFQLVVDF